MKRGDIREILRAIPASFALLAFLLAAPVAFAGEAGDYNNDGAVDDADKQIILDARDTTTADPGFVEAADHDGDGIISLLDVSAFAKLYNAQN